MPCPRCGHHLWFVKTVSGFHVFVPDELAGKIAARLGIDREEVRSLSSLQRDQGFDSLDLVELHMELEEDQENWAD